MLSNIKEKTQNNTENNVMIMHTIQIQSFKAISNINGVEYHTKRMPLYKLAKIWKKTIKAK